MPAELVHILLVEDNESHAELMRRGFERHHGSPINVEIVDHLQGALEAIDRNPPDLVLTDLLLPDGRGTELLGTCQERDIPVVILTSHGDETVAVEAMKSGALDYVVKSPETLAGMPRIIERSLREWGHIREQRRLENELRQSQKLEAIGQLSSGIAHDFNNLLMAIIGCADLALRRLEEDHPAAEFVSELRRAARRGSSLSSQLVSFSRKPGGASARTFDLNAMMSQSRRLLQPLVGERINFHVEAAQGELPVYGDRSQLEQVLFNLVVNARDAMPGGGMITLRTDRMSSEADAGSVPDEFVVLEVADTGSGIPPDTLQHIFEPFFTTKPVGKGTGLGLSTVYGIVKQMGGDIHVDSRVGEGTRFTILLPRTQTLAEADASEAELALPGGDETILLIEDERLVRLTMRTYLQQAGYRVVEASDGEEALDVVENYPGAIDAVVSDVVLPGSLDGPTTVARLKQDRDFAVLFVSAHSAEQLVRDGRLTETDETLRKPVTEAVLLRAVRECLDHHESASSAGVGTQATPRVLFVDDYDLAREATCSLLSDFELEAVGAATGGEALHALTQTPFDAVIVDFGLPDMPGAELMERLRAESPNLPVIFVSGRSAEDDVVVEALRAERTVFVSKPFEVDELAAVVRELLRDG